MVVQGTGECTIQRRTYNRDRIGYTLITEILFIYSVYPLRKPPPNQEGANLQDMRKSFLDLVVHAPFSFARIWGIEWKSIPLHHEMALI